MIQMVNGMVPNKKKCNRKRPDRKWKNEIVEFVERWAWWRLSWNKVGKAFVQ